MNPAFSVVLFTAIAGMAQGLVVALALVVLGGLGHRGDLVSDGLLLAAVMLVAGLGFSFLHLGRPGRAWRAALMWRTSWLSREVIVLPAFIAIVVAWWALSRGPAPEPLHRVVLPVLAVVAAAALWYCTAMIYACLRFIEEWAHRLTLVNFTLLGLSSGFLLASAGAALAGEAGLLRALGPFALALTVLAWAGRALALRRNAAIRHRSTLQSATGIQSPVLVQTSMGMSAGSFNTREFFHRATLAGLRRIRLAMLVFGYVLPAALAVLGLLSGSAWPWWCAVLVQAPGLLADRWFFFAQAKHPQNLYYQVVS